VLEDIIAQGLIAPNFTAHEQEEMRMIGVDGFKELLSVYRTAFPDMRLTIEEIVAEGDKVVTWATFTGTHRGPLQSFPATGKSVKVKDVDTAAGACLEDEASWS
jgi:predicted ester cyclase